MMIPAGPSLGCLQQLVDSLEQDLIGVISIEPPLERALGLGQDQNVRAADLFLAVFDIAVVLANAFEDV